MGCCKADGVAAWFPHAHGFRRVLSVLLLAMLIKPYYVLFKVLRKYVRSSSPGCPSTWLMTRGLGFLVMQFPVLKEAWKSKRLLVSHG